MILFKNLGVSFLDSGFVKTFHSLARNVCKHVHIHMRAATLFTLCPIETLNGHVPKSKCISIFLSSACLASS